MHEIQTAFKRLAEDWDVSKYDIFTISIYLFQPNNKKWWKNHMTKTEPKLGTQKDC